MANVSLSISTVNFTNYFIAVLYYNDEPNAEVARITIAPADLTGANNVIFTDLLPKGAEVRYYESADGTALTTLKNRVQITINEKINIEELRYYTVGGSQVDEEGVLIDPVPGSRELTDSYFEGRTVASVFREGYRDLKEWKADQPFDRDEWKRVDNTIQLINPDNGLMDGPLFNSDEVYVVKITYLQDQIIVGAGNSKISFADITDSTTLTSANRNRVNIIDVAAAKKVVTSELLATMSEGDYYEFKNDSAHQVLFKCTGSDVIKFNKINETQFVVGVEESLKIAKKGSSFEVFADPARRMVGQFLKSYNNVEIGALLCDGVDRDGDQYPDIWKYINRQPVGFAINSATVTEGKEACWYYWTVGSAKHFRTPNKQNGFGRNLKDFTNRTDAERKTFLSNGTFLTNDNPGGKQDEMSPPHRHFDTVPSQYSGEDFPSVGAGNLLNKITAWIRNWAKPGSGKESYYAVASGSEPSNGRTSKGHVQYKTTGTVAEQEASCVDNYEGRPTNYGEFEFVRI